MLDQYIDGPKSTFNNLLIVILTMGPTTHRLEIIINVLIISCHSLCLNVDREFTSLFFYFFT